MKWNRLDVAENTDNCYNLAYECLHYSPYIVQTTQEYVNQYTSITVAPFVVWEACCSTFDILLVNLFVLSRSHNERLQYCPYQRAVKFVFCVPISLKH